MSFRRPKPKFIIPDDEADDDIGTFEKSASPVGFKKNLKPITAKKKKRFNISFEDPNAIEAQIDDIVIKPKQAKAKIGSLPPLDVLSSESRTPPDDESESSTVYTPTFMKQLKSRNKVKQDPVPKNSNETMYKVIETESVRTETVVPDDFTIKEMRERKSRQQYIDLKDDAEGYIALEDQDREFQYLNSMNEGPDHVDKQVDFEIDLHEDFADERLPLTENETKSQRQKAKFEKETAFDNFDEMDGIEDTPVTKTLGTIEEQRLALAVKAEEFNDVKERNEEQLQVLLQQHSTFKDKQAKLLLRLQDLASSYS